MDEKPTKTQSNLEQVNFPEVVVTFEDRKLYVPTFVRVSKLKNLQNVQKEFKCEQCDYVTKLKGNLKVHQVVHTRERNFKCDYCPHKATQSASLKTHVKLKHGEPVKLTCELCEYQTALKGNLKKHMVVHTGAKNFKSPVCDFKAGQPSTVATHIRLCHTKDLEMFRCENCSYETAHKGNLKKHGATHH